MLKKCSTLPSKPFFLSITTPTRDDEPISEGSDLRIKVLGPSLLSHRLRSR